VGLPCLNLDLPAYYWVILSKFLSFLVLGLNPGPQTCEANIEQVFYSYKAHLMICEVENPIGGCDDAIYKRFIRVSLNIG
jgi:hypothetical protein